MLTGKKWWRLGMLLGLTLLLAASVRAQTALPETRSREWIACLTKGQDELQYPEQYQQLREGGFVRFKLVFRRADQAPELEVLARSMRQDLLEDVRVYLKQYRLPCLPAGESVVAVQEVRFSAVPSTPILWGGLLDVPEAVPQAVNDCLRTPANPIKVDWNYRVDGRRALKNHENLVVELRFDAADSPPKVKVLYDSAPAAFRKAVLSYVDEYRWPCFVEGGRPMEFEQQFHLANTSDKKLVLKDLRLLDLLGVTKDIDKAQVYFDFNTMACPFDLVLGVGMPAFPNSVSEVGERNLNRIGFLKWLKGLSLNLMPDDFEQLLGQKTVVTVPCGVLSLGQSESQP